VQVHLIDGTYELFRQFFARPSHVTAAGQEVGATRAVLDSVLALVAGGTTHVAVATDHVIESFRNDLWSGYKSSAGMPPELLGQFQLLEDALTALGVVVWPMVELEADDALAAGAKAAAADPAVDQVVICTPDKDLAQCVHGTRVVQLDRRKNEVRDEQGVVTFFGVTPESIPDWLALVGDSADGYPGLPGWGKQSAATVLRRYRHIEDIPQYGHRWEVDVRGANRLAGTLADQRDLALLFRDLATLRADAGVLDDVEDLRWKGPAPGFDDLAEVIDAGRALTRARELAPT